MKTQESAPLLARRVWMAVNAAERRICGDATADTAAAAEGLALGGRRSAHLIDPLQAASSAQTAVGAAWVDHRISPGAMAIEGGPHEFELAASTGQQAVDHCLVAHRVAASVRRPVLCTIDRVLADELTVVRLPDARSIEAIPAVDPRRPAGAPGPDVAQAALEAFAAVTRETGRPLGPVSRVRMDGARYAVVAPAGLGRLIRQTVLILRESGIPCGALILAQVRPFPADLFEEQLADIEAVALLSSGAGGFGELLARRAQAALGSRKGSAAIVSVSGVDPASLCHELGRVCGFDPPARIAESPPPAKGVAIGGMPGSTWMENLLLDTAARLGEIGSPELCIEAPRPDGVVSLVIGERRPDDSSLDLLVVPWPADLGGTEALERLRECGNLLIQTPSGNAADAWAVLTAEQRSTMLRKRLRLRLLACDVGREELQGAILAAVPEIAATLGCEGNVVELLDDAALGSGARALGSVDPAKLGEPAPVRPSTEAVRPPRLPRKQPVVDAQSSSERLRRFHFTSPATTSDGMGSWSALRPAILQKIDSPVEVGSTLFERWTGTVLADRRRRRAALLAEAEAIAQNLRRVLGLAAPASGKGSVEDLQARLGQVGAEFIDPRVLLKRLSVDRASAGLPAERRQRLTAVLTGVERSRELLTSHWPIAFVLSSDRRRMTPTPGDVRVLTHEDALRVATGLFDGLAHRAVELARSMRLARLEVGQSYDESVHGPALERLDRLSLSAEELLCVPAVVVLENAPHLRGPALAAFSEVIRAGRPVHVLIEENLGGVSDEGLRASSGYHPGLGYLAVGHREALVVQSSAGRPAHLTAGLERAALALDPVVVIAAMPCAEWPASAGEQVEAAVQSRATPCFVYDPAGGASWAERFTLDGNPQADLPWPVHRVACEEPDGREKQLEQAFTFAHLAALDPRWRSHFQLVGPEAWHDEQIEVAEYLQLADRERSKRLPYLWVVENGELVRAAMRWELVFACRDRARAWRILQELAGTENAYARRAAEETRRAVLDEAEQSRSELEADFAVALAAARGAGARAALERLVELLADPRGLVVAAGESRQVPPADPQALPTPAPLAEAPAAGPDEPYIDSFLCTTCNDCINLNPRMFRYNQDKQAEIADPAAGDYKQLVKAAEMCPARCIHPGTPREGDGTATPAILERAARFRC